MGSDTDSSAWDAALPLFLPFRQDITAEKAQVNLLKSRAPIHLHWVQASCNEVI
jgi:hypothetical protein